MVPAGKSVQGRWTVAEVLRPERKVCAWGTIGKPCGWKRGREEGEMHPEESWEGES